MWHSLPWLPRINRLYKHRKKFANLKKKIIYFNLCKNRKFQEMRLNNRNKIGYFQFLKKKTTQGFINPIFFSLLGIIRIWRNNSQKAKCESVTLKRAMPYFKIFFFWNADVSIQPSWEPRTAQVRCTPVEKNYTVSK